MAERSNFNDVVIDREGNALGNILVTVTESGDSDPTNIYYGKEGGFTPNEFLTTSGAGEINFWAEPGSYDISLIDQNTPKRVGDKTFGWEAVSGDTNSVERSPGISLSQIDLESDKISQSMLGENSVGSSQFKYWAAQATGLTTTSSSDATMVSQSGIPPGKYMVSATIGKASGAKSGFSFASGTGTIHQSAISVPASSGPTTVTCWVEVDTTATLVFKGPVPSGNTNHLMTIFGVQN